MWVVDTVEGVVTAIYAQFELADRVGVTRDSEYAFSFRTAKGEDTIGQEGKDNGNFLVGIVTLLETDNCIEGFTKRGRIEGSILGARSEYKLNEERIS